ncbi:DNA primase [Campylobacter sp. RM16187]|uniref:DNA primase n=1 Tax=Campylobacter sp. RM16187 TaxID=1660063 RepID=UPI0021B61CC5|nr:DNA primase [Campylobacter sp. RM16187]QKG28394.1 DNA primase [Campylobacter sp. RM16187]
MIDPKSIEKLKEQADIIDIVGHYIPLKKSGSNYVCVCPFHDDKNPSMSVSPSRGIFHCFSCKAGGDVIKFVMDYEKLTYPEAIEKIAMLSNFTLNYVKNERENVKENKHVLEKANAYYRSLLYKTPAAIEYLYSRGVTDALCAKFELGYAPDSIQTIRLLENEQILPNEALESGIVKQNESGIYASFIQRITFPIYTHTGKLVGFGGRTLGDHPAKYVNSPQSEIFDKSTLFYGYHLAKRDIHVKNQIIITEGYLDVMMLHHAGFTNAVAVLGTALTQKHLPLLKRGELSVVLCFDGDSAGINAAVKSAHLLAQNEIDGSVVILEGGADPADMVVAGKIKELHNLFENGVEIGEFYIRNLIAKFDLARPVQKQRALEEVREFTMSLKPIIANSYAPLVASLLKIDINSFTLANLRSKVGTQTQQAIQVAPSKIYQKDKLELELLKTLAEANGLSDMILDLVKKEYFAHHGEIFEAILRKAPEDEVILREISLENVDVIESEEQILEAVKILKIRFYENMRREYLASNRSDKIEILRKIGIILEKLKR